MEENEKENKPAGLSGTEINSLIDERIKSERQKWDMELLREENGKLSDQVKEAEEYIDKLEKALQEEKPEKSTFGNINVGELASVALEGLIRRNTGFISKLPGGEALAGAIRQDNGEKEETQETQASFKKKEQKEAPALSEEDKQSLQVLNMMKSTFSEGQLRQVWGILQELSIHPDLIPTVLQLVQPSGKESGKKENIQK